MKLGGFSNQIAIIFYRGLFLILKQANSLDILNEELTGGDCDIRGARFNAGLMDLYTETLSYLSKQEKLTYVSYGLVQNKGVHNQDRFLDQPSWPVIHVIRGDINNQKKFSELVEKIHSETAYEFIKKKEGPQNYRMKEVDYLREEGINPLILDERIWEVDGKILKNAIDFLCNFYLSYKWTGSVIDMD